MPEMLLTQDDIMKIPPGLLPMAVLSDSMRSLFGLLIKQHESGVYNHFMWLNKPQTVASQGWTFKEKPVSDYFAGNRLKFWFFPSWTPEQKQIVCTAIDKAIALPWYKRIYDVPAILGQLLPEFMHGLIQIPGLKICSDWGNLIGEVEGEYKLAYPDPAQVDGWLKKCPNAKVYGRYVPD